MLLSLIKAGPGSTHCDIMEAINCKALKPLLEDHVQVKYVTEVQMYFEYFCIGVQLSSASLSTQRWNSIANRNYSRVMFMFVFLSNINGKYFTLTFSLAGATPSSDEHFFSFCVV